MAPNGFPDIGKIRNSSEGKSTLLSGFLDGKRDRIFSADDEEYDESFRRKMKALRRKANGSDLEFVEALLEQEGYAKGFLGRESPFERR